MSDYTITKIRREWASDGSHQHIEGVLTKGGSHYTRRDVVKSIQGGHSWGTNSGGFRAIIRVVDRCPAEACDVAPYIVTNPDSSQ
ncbi:MAG: DUF3892 domain-containing protein, partial [Mycobacteriales bacterium]